MNTPPAWSVSIDKLPGLLYSFFTDSCVVLSVSSDVNGREQPMRRTKARALALILALLLTAGACGQQETEPEEQETSSIAV